MNDKYQSEAYRRAVIWGIVAVPLLFVAWLIATITAYFATGGSIVGGHDSPTPGRDPANLLITITAVLLNYWIVIGVYKSRLLKQKPSLGNKPIPNKVQITGILIPLIAILAYIGYFWFSEWFSENKSGLLNPLTDDCMRIGAKGAKGADCVWK